MVAGFGRVEVAVVRAQAGAASYWAAARKVAGRGLAAVEASVAQQGLVRV